MRGRPKNNEEVRRKYTMEFDDSIWYYDLDKFANGPYLVEIKHPELDKLEKLCYKLERLQKPKFHENGRKKEQLKLTKSRLKILKLRIGKNIIDSFQTTYPKDVEGLPKEKTMSEAEQIEEIL